MAFFKILLFPLYFLFCFVMPLITWDKGSKEYGYWKTFGEALAQWWDV